MPTATSDSPPAVPTRTFDLDAALADGASPAQVADYLASVHSYNVGAARQAGASDQQIAEYLSTRPRADGPPSNAPATQASAPTDAPPPPADTSYTGALKQGAADVVTGAGETARVLGLPNVADTIDSYAPSVPKGYQRATSGIADDLRAGRYADAAFKLPRAAVEGGAALAGGLAAGAGAAALAPEALAGTAAAAGGAAFAGATGFGNNVEAHAANDGRNADNLNAGDYLAGGITTGAQAALSGVGLRPGVVPAVGRAMARSTAARVGANVLGDAAAGAGNSVIGQVGTTAGTQKGLTVDPADVAAAAGQGATARLGSEAPAVVRAGSRAAIAGRNAAADAVIGTRPTDTDTATSIVATDKAVQDVQAQSSGRMSYTDAASVVKDRLESHARSIASALADGDVGGLSREDVASVVRPLIDAATTPGVDATATAKAGQTATPMDRFAALDLPAPLKDGFASVIRDLNTATDAASATPGTGFRKAGEWIGQGAALLGAAHGVSPVETVVALAGGHKGLAGHAGGAIGSAVGNVVGANRNPVQASAGKAAGMLGDGAAGLPSALASAGDFASRLSDPQAATRLSLGLTEAPDGAPVTMTAPNEIGSSTFTPNEMAKGTALNEAAANQLSGLVKRAQDRAAAQQAADAQRQAQQDAAAEQKARNDAFDLAYQQGTYDNRQVDLQAAAKARADAKAQGDQIAYARQEAEAEEAQRQREMQLQEQAANRLQGQLYKGATDARAAGLTGAAAIGPQTPQAIFQRSNGLAGSPAAPSDPLVQPATPQPAGASEPAMVQAARAKVNPRAAALMAQRGTQGDAGAADVEPTTAQAPQPTQAGPTAFPGGWRNFVARGMEQETGYRPTSAEIGAALDTQALAGHIDPVVAAAMRRSSAAIPASQLQGVIAQVAHDTGHGHRLTSDAPPVVQAAASRAGQGQQVGATGPASPAQPAQGPTLPPVRDPLRWQAARQDAQQHVAAVASAAEARGDHALAQVVRQIGAERTAEGKAKLAADFLRSLGDAKTPANRLRLGLAQQVLSDGVLLKGV